MRFSAPKSFDIHRQKSATNVAYLPHQRYDLELFAATPDGSFDSAYINSLATLVASYLFPKEEGGLLLEEVGWL